MISKSVLFFVCCFLYIDNLDCCPLLGFARNVRKRQTSAFDRRTQTIIQLKSLAQKTRTNWIG